MPRGLRVRRSGQSLRLYGRVTLTVPAAPLPFGMKVAFFSETGQILLKNSPRRHGGTRRKEKELNRKDRKEKAQRAQRVTRSPCEPCVSLAPPL
ncbi:MAG: hypothetical protein AVDCRST_MAG56-6828 [uncultured Cytophagales bacterium]|uniref:Uncharacterized protein n=1 Tax=uncultured Cytophagales bacterium TaxID=158755 RepID=A0A6J4KZB7_9SPHI|nr:MAG: hypothetical protein AVDCRST_MAG56-6828 [uncultured Cytophagales bacterium]